MPFSQSVPHTEADRDCWAFLVDSRTPFPAAWRNSRIIIWQQEVSGGKESRLLSPSQPSSSPPFLSPISFSPVFPSSYLLTIAQATPTSSFHYLPQKFRGPYGMLRKGYSLAWAFHGQLHREVISFQKVSEIAFQQEGTQ